MNNEIPQLNEEQVRHLIRDEFQEFLASDRYIFHKLVQFLDGRNIQTGRTTGTKIGIATDNLLGFYGKTPVDQPATISDPSGGDPQDAQARAAINSLIDRLQELGLLA